MSKLISMRPSGNVGKETNNGSSCEACGKVFDNPIRLTNLSASPMQTYDACPFCFSRVEEVIVEETTDFKVSTPKETKALLGETKNRESPNEIACPHHFGYLKKRPKNAPIPDTCLTCQKMIQCLL